MIDRKAVKAHFDIYSKLTPEERDEWNAEYARCAMSAELEGTSFAEAQGR